jgi:hypothetical protein
MKRAMLLAAVACVAMFALPAVASAGVWHVQNGTIGFSGSGGAFQLTPAGGTTTDCSSASVQGAYETTTTGWIEFAYHGCLATTIFNPHCQSVGQPTGTIKTTKLTFHNVRNSPSGKPTILLTGGPTGVGQPKDHFATFSCFGIATVVTGNGLLGEMNKNCGEKISAATITFNSTEAGVPSPWEVTGTKYTPDFTTSGTTRMASVDAAWSFTFNGGAEQTIECT